MHTRTVPFGSFGRDCGSFFGSRANSESLTLKGEDRHDVFDEPSVVHKLTAFLLRLAQ